MKYLVLKDFLCLNIVFVALGQCQRRTTTTTEEPWIWSDRPNNQNPSTETTTQASGRTTPFRRNQPTPRICPGCPKTPQFNPVCGSDMATYDNPTAVDCANTCGPSKKKCKYIFEQDLKL